MYLEIQQLEYFRTVAKMEHMTRAAEKLNISQPALSKSISNIEHDLGLPLFDRQGRSIYLNKYGQLFLKSVDNILAEYYKAKQEFEDIQRPGYGEVSFGFIHTLGIEVVPELMASIQANYPNMQFSLTQATSYILLKQLEEGAIDICLSQKIESKLIDIETIDLWTEELFIIVPNNHYLAKYDEVDLEEIRNEPFISIKRGNSLHTKIDELFQSIGLTQNTTFSAEEMHTVTGFVGAGLGVSIIPDIKGLEHFNVKKLRVSSPPCFRTIGISWATNRYLSPAANEFRHYVIDYFKERT